MSKPVSLVVYIIPPHSMLAHNCYTAEDKLDFLLNTYSTNK